jgi:hypothetical protein
MASGSISAQSKKARPGNRHMAVSQASPTPSSRTPSATPVSSRVLVIRSPSTVEARCLHTGFSVCSQPEKTSSGGRPVTAARGRLARCQ